MESEYSPITSDEEEVHRDTPPASPTVSDIDRYELPGGITLSPVSNIDRFAPPTPEYANEEQYWLANPVTEAERDHAIAEAEYEQQMAAIGGRAENHWSFSPVSEEESPAPAVTRSGTRYRRDRSRSRSRSRSN
jgi:hypothetical protein